LEILQPFGAGIGVTRLRLDASQEERQPLAPRTAPADAFIKVRLTVCNGPG